VNELFKLTHAVKASLVVQHCDSRWNQIIDATYTLYSKLAYLGFYFENGEVKVKDNPEVADNVQAL
jgi:hypothetical protein